MSFLHARHFVMSGRELILLACFLGSGVSGLIYQVVWTRKLTLVFGSSTLAVSICLAAFLGGMAIGAYLIGRLADRFHRPALAYGAMETVIGIYGLLSGLLLASLGTSYIRVQQVFEFSDRWQGLVQLTLVSIVLLLPTMLMGGTLPILVRAAEQAGERLGATTGRLYAVNTAGAALGAALAGFVVLPRLGLQGSLIVAATINIVLGLVVLWVFRAGTLGLASYEGSRSHVPPVSLRASGWLTPRVAALIVSVSGFCALFYEVVWTRALELVLGSSTTAFSLMLATVLLGLAMGIAVSALLIRRGFELPLAVVQLGIGLSVFAGAWMFPRLPEWFLTLYSQYGSRPAAFLLSQAALCAVVLLVPTLFIGLVFPAAVEIASRDRRNEAGTVGWLFAVNTLGAILGALVAGLWIIPRLGIQRALVLGALVNIGLAAFIGVLAIRGALVWRMTWVAGMVLVGAVLTVAAPTWDRLMMTSGVYFHAPVIAQGGVKQFRDALSRMRLLFYEEGLGGTVTVTRVGSHNHLSISGRGEGSDVASAQVLLGHLPFAMGRPIQDVFIIGMGTGSTAGAVTLHAIHHVEVAEIEPAVIRALRFFDTVNHRPLADRRVRTRIADGRSLLLLRPPSSFDAIVSQPSFPWVSGSAKLFTTEFYQLARSRLRPNGLFAQWVQLYNMDRDIMRSFLATFVAAFPQTLAFEVSATAGEIILVGSVEPVSVSWVGLQNLFSHSIRVTDLTRVGLTDAPTALARLVLGPDHLRTLTAGALLNTDDNGLIEFAAARNLYRDTVRDNVEMLRSMRANPLDYVRPEPSGESARELLLKMATAAQSVNDRQRGADFVRASLEIRQTVEGYYSLGDLLYASERGEALAAWRRALELAPEDALTLQRLVEHYEKVPVELRPPDYAQWVARYRKLAESEASTKGRLERQVTSQRSF